jgi:TolB-like protein
VIIVHVRHRLVGLEEFEVLAKGSAQRGFDDLPRLILSGTVARQDEGFRVLVQLLDLSAGQYVASVAFDVAAQAPGHAERIAAERIIAQLNGLVAAG